MSVTPTPIACYSNMTNIDNNETTLKNEVFIKLEVTEDTQASEGEIDAWNNTDDAKGFVIKKELNPIEEADHACDLEADNERKSNVIIIKKEIIKVEDTKLEVVTFKPESEGAQSSSNDDVQKYMQYYCKRCNKQFFSKEKHYLHVLSHNENKLFICSVCNKSFTTSSNRSRHMRIHNKKISLEDSYQKHVENNHDSLQYELNKQIGIKPLHTQWDPERIKEKEAHPTHFTDGPYTCDVCRKTFNYKSALIRHIRIHTGEKPFACSRCFKTFISSSNWHRHMRIHTEEKPYACHICERKFKMKGHLQQHMTRHSGNKLYACTRCNKKFARKSHIPRHMRIHTGEKPFACDKCDAAFYQKGGLQIHMRVHTGENPHMCRICNKSFNHACHLRAHMRTHTGEKPHPCTDCGKTFTSNYNLQRHRKIHIEKLNTNDSNVIG